MRRAWPRVGKVVGVRRRSWKHGSRVALLLAMGLGVQRVFGAAMSPLPGIEIDPESGIEIEIVPFFEEAPLFGFDAFQVRVRNSTGRTHSWNLVSLVRSGVRGSRRGRRTRSIRSSHRMTVEAEAERLFEIVIPVGNSARYQNVSLRIGGFGVNGGSATHAWHSVGASSSHPPTLAMSRELAVTAWGLLEDELTTRHRRAGLPGTRFDADRLPTDWRAYTGFAGLWMLSKEWRELDPRSRSAVADWIAQGGRLYLVPLEEPGGVRSSVDPPGHLLETRWVHGAGWTQVAPLIGGDLDAAWAAEEYMSASPWTSEQLAGKYAEDTWPLHAAIGEAAMRIGLVLAFLIGFAVLVGPVNLFVFCRGTLRQRVLWTTPLIAVAASLLLALVVIFQEGTGGRGLRTTVALLLPDQNRMVVGQEQITRTGALLSTGFDTGEEVLVEPIELGDIRGARTGSDLEVAGDRYSGRWFVSRSVQAHYVQAVRPSRARIEMRAALIETGPPEVTSTIGAAIARLFVVDARGNLWTADGVEPGVARRLRRSDEKDMLVALLSARVGPRLGDWLSAVADRPGFFFAWAAEDAGSDNGVSVPTLPSIRWSEDHLLFAGPIVEARR